MSPRRRRKKKRRRRRTSPKKEKKEKKKDEDRPTLEEATAETEELWKKYRKSVDEHAKKRGEYFDQSKKEYEAGNKAEAKELSEKGHKETELMEKAQKKAAEAIFKSKNKNQPEGTIDLHGLLQKEALLIVEEQLEKAKKKGKSELRIITGAGHHSDKEGPKIKPAVQKFLNEQKYKWSEDSDNTSGGSLTVTL
eukprot:TRINITY_DN5870_c0_g1_i1.p1 TRINITY_DN5870_c0_g1~~TRINITY_DN5870_c0_g1_i1.p1  ORF type:complete len:194 (+),score=53.64 TRINITY_DN5870_c0_g1_i1:1-582(+)